jgi:hypothetical protein
MRFQADQGDDSGWALSCLFPFYDMALIVVDEQRICYSFTKRYFYTSSFRLMLGY